MSFKKQTNPMNLKEEKLEPSWHGTLLSLHLCPDDVLVVLPHRLTATIVTAVLSPLVFFFFLMQVLLFKNFKYSLFFQPSMCEFLLEFFCLG